MFRFKRHTEIDQLNRRVDELRLNAIGSMELLLELLLEESNNKLAREANWKIEKLTETVQNVIKTLEKQV